MRGTDRHPLRRVTLGAVGACVGISVLAAVTSGFGFASHAGDPDEAAQPVRTVRAPEPGPERTRQGHSRQRVDATRQEASRPPPNIVVIVTDDQTTAAFNRQTMPATWKLLTRRGAQFTNSYVTTPACCPSRAAFQTGQYGHNNGITANSFDFFDLREPRNILPVWLRRQGYRTAHVGKYRYFYDSFDNPFVVLPGWSEWRTTTLSFPYYNYSLSNNGTRQARRDSNRAYLTRVLNTHALRIIRRHVPRRKPLYLQLDHIAPHRGLGRPSDGRCHQGRTAVPDPKDQFRFSEEPLPRPASFNEADVSDKPSFIQRLDPIDQTEIQQLQLRYQCDLASLRGVDRGVARIVRGLKRTGELSNTAIIFTSDNGMLYGEHRIKRAKVLPYEPSARVPLVIRLPRHLRDNDARADQIPARVANIDLAPTILQLARAQPCLSPRACRTLDGRSLLGLARGRPETWPERRPLLIEWKEAETASVVSGDWSCEYEAVRTDEGLYVEHLAIPNDSAICTPGLEIEHYDAKTDPDQINNLHPATPGSAAHEREVQLRDELATLRDCAGIRGRDPVPESGHFCS